MKNLKYTLSLILTLAAFSSFAGTSNLVKTDREDFGALIAEGVEAQKELRQELRVKAGLPELEHHWTKDINESGRVIVGTVEAEQVVSPTTNYVRKAPVRQGTQDIQQKRIANEYNSLSH